MGLNDTPGGERVRIGFFGVRNAGKSSVVNAVTGQDLAVVSALAGTTTDPVYKAMELLPLGPVTIVDTPGMDDEGELGSLRLERTRRVLEKVDLAVLVLDALRGRLPEDEALLRAFRERGIPCLVAWNKCDLLTESPALGEGELAVSARTGEGIEALKERLAGLRPLETPRTLIADLVGPSDLVVLVVPIDGSAPKGRLILPQQQTIRALLEADAVALVVRDAGLKAALANLGTQPKLVVTDSQVFGTVAAEVPDDVPLTSFSILFARYKGDLECAVRGAAAVDALRDGERVLIAEGCTHHRQCEDIGTVKLPRWIREHTGRAIEFAFASGTDFPSDVSPYGLVVHCGGCMLNAREMRFRQRLALREGVPVTNYGVLIAHMRGILRRSLTAFPEFASGIERPFRLQ